MQLIGYYLREDDKAKFEELCGLPGIIAGQTAVTIDLAEFTRLKRFPFGDKHRATLYDPMVDGGTVFGRNERPFVALFPNEGLRLETDAPPTAACPLETLHDGSLKLARKPGKCVSNTGGNWVVPHPVYQLLSCHISLEPIALEYEGRELSDATAFSVNNICDEACTPIVPPSNRNCSYCKTVGKSIPDLYELDRFPDSEAVAYAPSFGGHRQLSPIIISNEVSNEINRLCRGQCPFGSVFEKDNLPDEIQLLKELQAFLFPTKESA